MIHDYFYGSQSESFSFYRIPRELVTGSHYKHLSTDAKLLYGLLLDRMSLSARNGWYDDLNRVYIYYTINEIMEDMCCGHGKAGQILAELDSEKGIGLIERVKQGQGKPARIYVKQFISPGPRDNSAHFRPPKIGGQDSRKPDVQTSEKRTSRPPKTGSQDIRKSDANYNDNIYTDYSYTDPSIYPSEPESVREAVREQIDYPLLAMQYPYDNPEEILELICDVMGSATPVLRIGGDNLPTAKVQDRFRQLRFEHIAYVMDALRESDGEIHNIRGYLLTALYNAPLTMGHYYSAAVRRDNRKS